VANHPEMVGAFIAVAPCCPADNQQWDQNTVSARVTII